MDTSQEYIAMCEKAVEIQGIRHAEDCVDRDEWWKRGDFAFSEDGGYIFTVCGVRHCAADTGYFNDEDSVWLPRQDQLQEMVRDKYPVPWVLAKRFAQKVYWISVDTAMSMEQLWLFFVMKELYSKAWDGTDWVKSNP